MREILVSPTLGLKVFVTLALGHFAYRLWPAPDAAWYRYSGSALFLGGMVYFGFPALLQVIKYHAQLKRKRLAREAERGERDAGFETEENIEKAGYFDPNAGIPVGILNGRIIFFPYTHLLLVAPAGSGKSIGAVLPALAHGYRIRGKGKHESHAASSIVLDLKRELRPMTERLRREVHGQRIVVLDPADPLTDSCNLLDPVLDCLHGDKPRARAVTMADLIAHQFEPEPANDPKNIFWRAGGRNILVLVILWLCEFNKDEATLIEVSRIVRDADALESVLLECEKMNGNAGLLGAELGVMARDILAQGKYIAEFRTGAALAVKAFSGAGELASVVGPSTFRWSDLKRESITVYICANLAESRAFAPWLRAIAEFSMMELEASVGNVPVHVCLDEASNVGFDVSKKLTSLRASGARIALILQEKSEGVRVWGKEAMDTICGEVDCEIYFHLQDHHLAQELEKRLGTLEVSKPSYQTGENPWDAYKESAAYQRKPLRSGYELMYRMGPKDEILILRSRKHSLRPILCQMLTYDMVKEWLAMLDANPIEGGKLPGPPTVSLEYTKRGVRVRSYKRTGPLFNWERMRRAAVLLPPLWAAWAAAWLWLGHAGWTRLVSMFA